MTKARNQLKTNSQAGVTLLFSVFVLAGVSVISLTVGFFAIQEIRASRAIILSEPAINAAETAAEQGLWLVKRSSGLTNCSTPPTPELLTNSKTSITKCVTYTSATVNIKPAVTFTFYLYDPANINGNLNPGYQNITVTFVAGSFSNTITVLRLDGTQVSQTVITPGSNPVVITLPTNPADDNRFKVTVSSAGASTLDLNTNLGMPDFPTMAAVGCSARSTDASACSTAVEAFKRKINILIPQ